MNDGNDFIITGEAASNTLRGFTAWGQMSAEPNGRPTLRLRLSWRSTQLRRLGVGEVAVELTVGRFKELVVAIDGHRHYNELVGVDVARLLTSPTVFTATVLAGLDSLDPVLWCAVVAGFEEALHRVRAKWPSLVQRFMATSALLGRAL